MKIVKKALIFDFDGVIADSISVKTDAFREIYSKYGEKVEAKVVRHHLKNGGMSRYKKIDYYQNNYLGQKLNQDQLISYCDKFSKLVINKVINAPLVSGIESFLNENYKLYKLFISTGTPEDEIKKIAFEKNLNKFFINIYGSPDNKKDHIEKIFKDYKILYSNMIFIGDSITDYNAAQKMNIKFILRRHKDNISYFKNYSGPNINDFKSHKFLNLLTSMNSNEK